MVVVACRACFARSPSLLYAQKLLKIPFWFSPRSEVADLVDALVHPCLGHKLARVFLTLFVCQRVCERECMCVFEQRAGIHTHTNTLTHG
jgi:hypothetical protein